VKKPEEIPDTLVEDARAAANKVPLTQNLSDEALRAILVVAWDFVYGHGYTDGFSNQEESLVNVELLKEHGWSPHYTMWFEGADAEVAETLMDAALEGADAAAPKGVNIAAIGVLSQGVRKTTPSE